MTRYVIARTTPEAEWRSTHNAYSYDEQYKAVKALRVPLDKVYRVTVEAIEVNAK